MVEIDKCVNEISFEEAYLKIDRGTIDYLIKGNEDSKYSIKLKKNCFLLISLFMPISIIVSYMGDNKNIQTTIFSRTLAITVAMVFIGISLFSYFNSDKNFKNYGYKEYIYTSLKILFLSYMCGSIGSVDSNYIINLITISIYIPTCLILYKLIENNKMKEYINLTFEKSNKINKILSLILSIVGIVIILGIVLVQLYRVNKSWIDKETIENSINGLGLNMISIIVGGALFMIIISLIPTYISFKADLRIQNRLVIKYSQEFMEAYGYYKKEWYGDK